MKVYLASGWWTDEQKDTLLCMEEICSELDISVYSPRKENLWKPGMDAYPIVRSNLTNIEACTIVLASTIGKDMGTLFECGYAYAKGVPIVYYHISGGAFNIMLAKTAAAVITVEHTLIEYLASIKNCKVNPDTNNHDWVGEMQ